MLLIRKTIYNIMQNAFNGQHPLTAAQARSVVKLALHAIRITAHTDPTSLDRIWDTKRCSSMLTEVQMSQTLSKDLGLVALVRQMITKLGDGDEEEDSTAPKAKKRKIDGTEVDKALKKVKRNKRSNIT